MKLPRRIVTDEPPEETAAAYRAIGCSPLVWFAFALTVLAYWSDPLFALLSWITGWRW